MSVGGGMSGLQQNDGISGLDPILVEWFLIRIWFRLEIGLIILMITEKQLTDRI